MVKTPKKRINSRAKGKRVELELAHYLTQRGHPTIRGAQHSGSEDSPDVKADPKAPDISRLHSYFHIECKGDQRLNVHDALTQADTDAGERVPCVMHKKNGTPWLFTCYLEDFLDMVASLMVIANVETDGPH